jgi:hypothetical protein
MNKRTIKTTTKDPLRLTPNIIGNNDFVDLGLGLQNNKLSANLNTSFYKGGMGSRINATYNVPINNSNLSFGGGLSKDTGSPLNYDFNAGLTIPIALKTKKKKKL